MRPRRPPPAAVTDLYDQLETFARLGPRNTLTDNDRLAFLICIDHAAGQLRINDSLPNIIEARLVDAHRAAMDFNVTMLIRYLSEAIDAYLRCRHPLP